MRLGWPATQWETGPEPKVAKQWPANGPQPFLRVGPPNWPKNSRANRRIGRKSPILAVCPASFRPFVVVALFFVCLLFGFYVVMLLSKLEAGGKTKEVGPKSGRTSGENQGGQLCFQV